MNKLNKIAKALAFFVEVSKVKWLFLLFILVPTIELGILIYSGQLIGFLPTISIILITGFVGAYLAKRQGVKAWNDINARMARKEPPGDAMIDGLCILIGGILLVIPGYVTDIFGFLLLFSGPRNIVRPAIHRWIYNRMKTGRIIIR